MFFSGLLHVALKEIYGIGKMSEQHQPKLNFLMATLEHVSAIEALVNRSYRGEASKKGWTTEADLLGGQRTDSQSIRDLIEFKGQDGGGSDVSASVQGAASVMLLATTECDLPEGGQAESPEVVGCVNLERKKTKAYLGMLTVDPKRQNFGLGRSLLEFSESWAQKNWQSEVIEMTVISSRRELIAWYQRRGYQLTGECRPFPVGDERFGLPKVVHLEFVVLEKRIQK